MRIVRICSEPDTRDRRLSELKQLLLDRKYSPGLIDSAIRKARAVPRCQAIQSVAKPKSNTRSIFPITFDTRLPNMQSIINKHWRAMVSMDSYLSDVFPDPPMIAYRRQRNIKDFLIKAKIHDSKGRIGGRMLQGMKKCNKPCLACPFISEGKIIKGDKFSWNIKSNVNC